MAETFMQNNIPLIMADNSRVQGHMLMKEAMASIPLRDPKVKAMFEARGETAPKELPGLMIFDSCEKVITDIRDIQADEKNPNDCAKDPHEVTHNVDMVRYFIISRVSSAERPVEVQEDPFAEFEPKKEQGYEEYMTGGEISEDYMGF
jgi:phage terminase large subunit